MNFVLDCWLERRTTVLNYLFQFCSKSAFSSFNITHPISKNSTSKSNNFFLKYQIFGIILAHQNKYHKVENKSFLEKSRLIFQVINAIKKKKILFSSQRNYYFTIIISYLKFIHSYSLVSYKLHLTSIMEAEVIITASHPNQYHPAPITVAKQDGSTSILKRMDAAKTSIVSIEVCRKVSNSLFVSRDNSFRVLQTILNS